MIRRGGIVVAVLAAFVATTAVPGPQVVAHRHGGGDHDHVHAFLTPDHDDHDDHDHRAHRHARRHVHHAHLPRVARDRHEPLAHVHVTSPFQPATPSTLPAIRVATRVCVEPARPPDARPAERTRETRSRAPPPPPLVEPITI